MAVIEPIKLDWGPGLYRQNTPYSCPPGRFNDGNLIRMAEGVRKPMKGWATGLTGTLTGIPRAAWGWKDNDGGAFAAFGTTAGLFTHDGAALDDITPLPSSAPSEFHQEDSTNLLLEDGSNLLLEDGFNAGDADAATWTLDNFGELLIACNDAEEAIYEWQPGGGGDAAVIANSPNASAIVTTEERFILALGADGDPRKIAFPDGENYTAWTPTSTNRAREILIQSKGVLMCGVRASGGALLFTDQEPHFARYVGLPDVYSVRRAGENCGIIGRHAKVAVDQLVYWMGASSFWVWSGYAEPLQCDIADDVFRHLNTDMAHKVWCWHNAAEGEVWFFYPRNEAMTLESGSGLLLEDDSPLLLESSSDECSHAAIYVYRGQPHWNHVELARTCGFEAGTFAWPVMADVDGAMLKHEYGWDYDGADRYLISGTLELSNGGALLYIDEIIPDELGQGDCEVYFHLSEYPAESETTIGPYSAAARIPVEAPARKVRMEIRASDATQDFRIGTYRAVVREWSAF
jgi:hypothetical protein